MSAKDDAGSASQSSISLTALARRLQAGDPTALSEIWNQLGPDLRRRARTRLRQYGIAGSAESMDICNSVLLDFLRRGKLELKEPLDLVRYIRAAVDNQVRDVMRRLASQKRDIRRNEKRPVDEMDVQDNLSSPSFCMIRSEILQRVSAELGDLGPSIVEMYLNQSTWVEVGAALGISADTARVKWNRAVQSVRASLSVSGE